MFFAEFREHLDDPVAHDWNLRLQQMHVELRVVLVHGMRRHRVAHNFWPQRTDEEIAGEGERQKARIEVHIVILDDEHHLKISQSFLVNKPIMAS